MAQFVNLDLGLAPHDPWVIKKALSDTDVFFLHLPTEQFEASIIPEMNGQVLVADMVNNGVEVKVHIVEEGHEAPDHNITLHLYNGLYSFTRGWYGLVREKNYKKGDVIGLMWDKWSGRFFLHLVG